MTALLIDCYLMGRKDTITNCAKLMQEKQKQMRGKHYYVGIYSEKSPIDPLVVVVAIDDEMVSLRGEAAGNEFGCTAWRSWWKDRFVVKTKTILLLPILVNRLNKGMGRRVYPGSNNTLRGFQGQAPEHRTKTY